MKPAGSIGVCRIGHGSVAGAEHGVSTQISILTLENFLAVSTKSKHPILLQENLPNRNEWICKWISKNANNISTYVKNIYSTFV